MPGPIKLKFIRPVEERIQIIHDGGEYGAYRPYGSHIGVDFSSAGSGYKPEPACNESDRTMCYGTFSYMR